MQENLFSPQQLKYIQQIWKNFILALDMKIQRFPKE